VDKKYLARQRFAIGAIQIAIWRTGKYPAVFATNLSVDYVNSSDLPTEFKPGKHSEQKRNSNISISLSKKTGLITQPGF
jgi:hypothetical protein